MSAEEYRAWVEHLHRDPFSTRSVVLLLAQLLAAFINAHRKEDAPPVSPADFIPGLERPAETPPPPATLADFQEFMRSCRP